MAVVSSTHASLPSLPQSPLLPRLSPRSPRPEVESMFTHEGSGQSPSNAHRGTSIREIEEEDGSGSGSGSGGKLYVAVGKDLKDSRSNIRWAARNLLDGDLKLVLLHVHHLDSIPIYFFFCNFRTSDLVIIKRAVCILGCRGRGLTPFRKKNLFFLFNPMLAKRLLSGITVSAELCKVPASQLEEKKLKAYRTNEKEEMNTLLNQYLDFKKIQVQAETLVIEKNSPATGIIELIDQNHITKLVMGTSSISAYDQMQYFSFIKRKRTVPKSKVAAIVHLQAKPYCQIFYICKEALACSREANRLSAQVESPRSSCASSVSDQSEFTPRSLSLPPGHPGSLGSKDEQALQRRSNSVSYTLSGLIEDSVSGLIPDSVENMSAATQQSIHMTPTGLSLNSSQRSTGGSSQSLKDLDSIDGSPAPVSIASSEEHWHSMVESIESEVFEQLQRVHNQLERSRKEASKGRQKAERDLFEASIMFKARENSLRKGKKEVEERLTREKTGLEKEHIHICNELQKANERREELENNFLQANSLMEELQLEKDHAVRQAEEMRQIIDNIVLRSTSALTEFGYEEIKEATNNFDDSKQIGQGGCGSVYKGFLRHTTVAIKKFRCKGTAVEKQFNDEVETLCRMRHPNLVNLIGVCREAKALVFEFLSNGSLEDRLQCKNQTKPLPWRMRIRIAADICTGLIFLHSNKPQGIAHGDLKPDNVLLDTSLVCKLADFGISRRLNLTNTTVTPYHQTDQIKGTMGYMDPVYTASGELTSQSDVYSFGVVLLRLLTGKIPLGLPNEVEAALSNEMLQDIIDTSAGEWPPEYTEELARLSLRCCRLDRKERPDLAKEVWGVLQAMTNCPYKKCQPPLFFI